MAITNDKILSPYSFSLKNEDLPEIIVKSLRYCLSKGLIIAPLKKSHDNNSSAVCNEQWDLTDSYYSHSLHAPVTLLPSPVPRDLFNQAILLAQPFNTLIDKIARNVSFLSSVLEQVIETDSFTKHLLEIYTAVMSDEKHQKLMLGIYRSDYMLQRKNDSLALKQIEINSIASSFASLGTLTRGLHSYNSKILGHIPRLEDEEMDEILPRNKALDALPESLSVAWKAYGNPNAVILFVVQPIERNQYDQLHLEYRLEEIHGVRVIRRTMTDLQKDASVEPSSRTLMVSNFEVAVVYFRAGYTPTDYISEKDWDVRLRLEQSMAIKCPSIGYHLAGTKKVQQVLAMEGGVEKHASPTDAKLIRACFAGLYSLDQRDRNQNIIEHALHHPSDYVLKPQREGGGNNIYEEELVSCLKNFSESQLSAHILMERIHAPYVETHILRDGNATKESAVYELGIFGTFLGDGKKEILNTHAGHLLRTKPFLCNDGGVAAGVACLDSPLLVDV